MCYWLNGFRKIGRRLRLAGEPMPSRQRGPNMMGAIRNHNPRQPAGVRRCGSCRRAAAGRVLTSRQRRRKGAEEAGQDLIERHDRCLIRSRSSSSRRRPSRCQPISMPTDTSASLIEVRRSSKVADALTHHPAGRQCAIRARGRSREYERVYLRDSRKNSANSG